MPLRPRMRRPFASPLVTNPHLCAVMTQTSILSAIHVCSIADILFKYLTIKELKILSNRFARLVEYLQAAWNKGMYDQDQLQFIIQSLYAKKCFVDERRRALVVLKEMFPSSFAEGGNGLAPKFFGIPYGL